MAGLITYSSVLLLARKRLERIERLLRGKVLGGGTVNEIERQVLFLARTALAALNSPPAPATSFDENSFTPWLAQGISQFAVLGSVGPEITKFAAQFAPSQAWLYDTLRTGNPDPTRSQVLARSTDFLLKFCEYVLPRIEAETDARKRAVLLEHMRAYALGHACYIATAAISAPYVDAVAFELGSSAAAPPRPRLSVQAVRGALEEGTSRQLYRRANPRGGDWNGWLPTPDQVPSVFFDAYSAAAAVTYGAGARVPGSKAFNSQLEADQPPVLSADLIRDGYGSYRLLTERGYAWNYGDWLLATLFMFIPPSLMFPFSALLPQGRHLRRDDAFFAGKPPAEQRQGERALFEVLTFPLAANALTPLIMTIWLMAGSYLGAGKETIFALVNAIIGLILAVAFFATLGTEVPDWVRWLFFFVVPLGLAIAHIVFVLARGGQDKRHWQLAMSSLSLVGIALVFVICFVAFLHIGVEDVVDHGLNHSTWFWVMTVIWFVIVGVLWLISAGFLTLLDNSTPGVTRNDFASGRKHYLRLFDDTALGTGPVATPPATLAQRLFPITRLPILKLWWTGAGSLFVRSDRDALVFAFAADGSGPTQTVLAPIAPMSTVEFGALLKKTLKDNAGNFSAELKAERFFSDEPLDPQLSSGAVFADHGDDRDTLEVRAAEVVKFRPVPAADQAPYLLSLAPPAVAAVRVGQSGALLPLDGAAAVPGPGTLNAIAAAGSVNVVGDASTRFLDTFVPGDVLETLGPAAPPPLVVGQQRVVVAVLDDQHLTVNVALPAFANGERYQRQARDRETDLTIAATTIAAHATVYRAITGTNTRFERDFMPGDVIRALPAAGSEERVVISVQSATQLTVNASFSANVPRAPAAGVLYLRPGVNDAQAFAHSPSDPTLLFVGNTVLDRAADLATLLCLGMSSRMLLPDERRAKTTGPLDQQHHALGEAWQVFRNWNLDHRRVNEWRMLVDGGAVSEKHGQPEQRDVLQPLMPAAAFTPTHEGEAVANQLGWVGVFARWLEAAQRPDLDTTSTLPLRQGEPSILALSKGLAYLLDMEAPA